MIAILIHEDAINSSILKPEPVSLTDLHNTNVEKQIERISYKLKQTLKSS